MSQRVVNAGWGPKGADTYDVFKYKGGGDCHHKWMRKTYRSKQSIDVKESKRTNSINEQGRARRLQSKKPERGCNEAEGYAF